jgi:hypothetical protein
MNDDLFDYFLAVLRQKFPQRAELTRALMDLLGIEKEAVYRRLRKEVAFTFSEVATIGHAWGISLDTVARVQSTQNLPFHLQLTDRVQPEESDFAAMRSFTEILRFAIDDPRGEIMEASNLLPLPLYSSFHHLNRFAAFKWMYQGGNAVQLVPFEAITIPEELQELSQEHDMLLKKIHKTFFILDHMTFAYLVNDIRYFASIYLITQEDVARLREELLLLLDYLEQLAATGLFPETGNKLYIYISPINFDTNYALINTEAMKVSVTRTFVMNAMISLDEYAFQKWKNCIHALKRSSTLISESGEKHRIEFFEKQRALVNKLDV